MSEAARFVPVTRANSTLKCNTTAKIQRLTGRSSGRQHWPWLRHFHGQCRYPAPYRAPAPLNLGVRPIEKHMFEALYPVPSQPGTHWVEWYEALLSNEQLLVRCVPLPDTRLPEGATSVLLNFGKVVAFRATQDPFIFTEHNKPTEYPREPGGSLSSLFMRANSSSWIEQAQNWHPSPMFHYVLVSIQDQVLEVLTGGTKPSTIFEHGTHEANPQPQTFHVPSKLNTQQRYE